MNLLDNSTFKIGTNYWPKSSAIKMWTDWNSQEIADDFLQMRAAGLDLVRFFLFTADFVKNGVIDPLQMDHYHTVLDHLKAAHIYGIPTLFIGHMSGQNYRVEGWNEDTFFNDPSTLVQQKNFIEAILKASKDSQHIAGWCLSNEIPNDFPGRNPQEVTDWMTEISRFIKDLDPRPFLIGDGVWSPEITGAGRENSLEPSKFYQLRDLAPLQDTLGVHFYPRYDDYWPQAYTSGFRIRMANSWKDSTFLEEFGHSIAMGSESNQALYYREVLFSALQAGASAGLNWCWTDFEKPELRPYLHNDFEMRFGLRRLDGSYRPALAEMRNIKKLSVDMAAEGWELVRGDSWFIIPAVFYHALPFDWDKDTDEKYNLYLHTYGALASSGALPMCIHEPGVQHRSQDHDIHTTHNASFGTASTIMWLPALKRISAPFWKQIIEHARGGSTLYASFANDHWMVDLDQTLGLKSDLRFGLPDYYPDEEMQVSSPISWGPFGSSIINLHLGELKNTRSLAYLKAEVLSSEILLEDQNGRPLLIRKPQGSGNIYFSLFPFEMLMMLNCQEAFRDFVTMMYAGIREDHQDITSSCTTGAGEFLRYTRNHDIKEFIFNHTWENRVFNIRLKRNKQNIENIRVELPPKSFCKIVDTVQDVSNDLEIESAIGMAK
ncbi:MAG: hypothetical protein K9N29_10770 [Candidatus Marinimicrobia bacterium]|nr:hypothetical protein [Candidatus Neomarinimicrobiota bacterium]